MLCNFNSVLQLWLRK